jgi:hypothetical protein
MIVCVVKGNEEFASAPEGALYTCKVWKATGNCACVVGNGGWKDNRRIALHCLSEDQ